MNKARLAVAILVWALVGVLSLSGGLSAQGYPMATPSSAIPPLSVPAGGLHMALGMSVFVGPTSGDPLEVVTGYDAGTIYTATGNAVEATDQALVLRRNGTYRIHLEGVLFMDKDDTTADADAAALFAILVDGVPWVVCGTPSNTGSPPLAVDWRASPDHEVAAGCKVDFTVRVRGAGDPGGSPIVFPKDSAIQAALIPNDRSLGDATLMLVRFEISRVR